MKKTMILAAAAVFTMVSCVKERIGVENGTQPAIVLGSSVSTIATRGPVDSDYTTLTAGVVGYTGSATVAAPTFIQDPITFTNGLSTTVTGQYYPSDGSAVKFVGYAPAGAALAAGIATFAIDGTQDVMYAPEVSGTKAVTTAPNLAFVHKLTQLQFQVAAQDAAAIAAWGNVTKIEVLGRENSIALNLATGAAAASGSAVFTAFTGSQALTTTLAGAGEGTMIYPLSSAALSLKVYTANNTAGQPIDLTSQTFAAGNAYKVNLTFKAAAVTLTATVTDWIDGSSVSQDIF